MSRSIASLVLFGLVVAHAKAAEPTAEDDAEFAIRVFQQQVDESRRLAAQGVISADEVDDLRIRLTDAKIQRALAVGARDELRRLLEDRITLAGRRLERVERLAEQRVVSAESLAIAQHDLREALIGLAAEFGDRREVVRLLQQQVASAEKQAERSRRLVEQRVATRTQLALERLHLATLKNRLEAALQELIEDNPDGAI